MRREFELINQNCRTASRLVSDARERPLTRLERWGLAIHLLGCRSCRRYRRQIAMIDSMVTAALERPQTARTLSASARERMTRRLKEACRADS